MKTALLSLLMTLGFSTAHAGSVAITVMPTSPIVFTSDFSTTDPAGNVTTIKGPWFQMSVHINNTAMDSLTLIGLHVEVSGKDASGNPITMVRDLTPAQFSYTTTNLSCMFSDFGQFDPNGMDRSLFLTPSSNSSPGCMGGDITFFIDGNPAVQNTSSIVYDVKVQPLGYFGTTGSPKSRFDDFVMISTQ